MTRIYEYVVRETVKDSELLRKTKEELEANLKSLWSERVNLELVSMTEVTEEFTEPLPPGRYRHFKGGTYRVITSIQLMDGPKPVELILYVEEPTYDTPIVRARTRHNFMETVRRDGYHGPRFVGPLS